MIECLRSLLERRLMGDLSLRSRERVLRALELEEPDKVPLFDFLYEHRSFERILRMKEIISLTPEIIVAGHKALGLDMLCVGAGPPEGWKNRRIVPDIEVDEWGIKYKLTSELNDIAQGKFLKPLALPPHLCFFLIHYLEELLHIGLGISQNLFSGQHGTGDRDTTWVTNLGCPIGNDENNLMPQLLELA